MNHAIELRPATVADAGKLSPLILELGYAISPELLHDKLAATQTSVTDCVFVAAADERLLGCISLHLMPLFHVPGNMGRITTLVVAEGCRGQGIGHALMERAHTWFAQAGCVRIELTSGDQRVDAHRFYHRHGYARQGQRLLRKLSPE